MPQLSDAARKIVSGQTRERYFPGDNLLFRSLYDAYCKLAGVPSDFSTVVARAEAEGLQYYYKQQCRIRRQALDFDEVVAEARARVSGPIYEVQPYKDACQELKNWYKSRYTDDRGKKGQSRSVHYENVFGAREYQFDRLYPLDGEDNCYDNYLFGVKPLWVNDARDFILHTAVAFLLPPEQLELLLMTYGFHPLHVRNIHHMSIYVVLLEGQSWTEWKNPFEEVKKLYQSARKLLNHSEEAESRELLKGEETAFAANSTRDVRNYLRENDLTRDNLLAFVGSHSEFYNLRHRRLLAEHKKLVDLFSELYLHRGNWEEKEPLYSLYEFLSQYCKDFERKHFYHHIYREIATRQRHPTREFMVVLWIYAYCYLFYPEVTVPCDFSKVVPFKETNKSLGIPEETPFARHYNETLNRLRVLEYLSDSETPASPLRGFYDGKTVPGTFHGEELVSFINEKLGDYSWRKLDGKNAFDYMVLSLGALRIELDETGEVKTAQYLTNSAPERGGGIAWNNPSAEHIPIEDIRGMRVHNVPGPLVLISHLLREVKAVISDSATGPDEAEMPLPCDMYEMI